MRMCAFAWRSVLTAHPLRRSVCVCCGCGVCSSPVLYKELGLSKVLRWVKLGLLDASEVITMKVCWGEGDRGRVCDSEQR